MQVMKYIKRMLLSTVTWLFPVSSPHTTYIHLSPEQLLLHAQPAYVEYPDTIAAFSYKDKGVRNLIWSLKYYHNKDAAKLLGNALALYTHEERAERAEYGTYLDPIVIPIPLHPEREKERGYNQSFLLAQAFVKQAGLPHDTLHTDILLRIKHTEALARSASREKRLDAIRDAFRVQNTHSIKNKDVILIDDVITSGATMNEAKRVLVEAGVREVLMFAIAH